MSRAEDYLAIDALYARYNRAIDAGEAAEWATTFVEDGVFHHPARTWRGHAELQQFVVERTTKFSSNPVVDQRHWNDAIAAVIEGDQAHASCDLLVAGFMRDSGAPQVVARGRYEDLLRQSEQGWRFVERRLTVL